MTSDGFLVHDAELKLLDNLVATEGYIFCNMRRLALSSTSLLQDINCNAQRWSHRATLPK